MASKGCSKSLWRSPAGRACCCSTNPPPAFPRKNGTTFWPRSTLGVARNRAPRRRRAPPRLPPVQELPDPRADPGDAAAEGHRGHGGRSGRWRSSCGSTPSCGSSTSSCPASSSESPSCSSPSCARSSRRSAAASGSRGARIAVRPARLGEACSPPSNSSPRAAAGALIVFPRAVGLRNIVQTGTPVNAELSTGPVVDLPRGHTPARRGDDRGRRPHRGGRLLPAPLRARGRRGAFGARHRAALGLAEETDAVVVVVCEENGAVSLAHDGDVRYNLSLPQIESGLRSLLRSAKGRAPLRRLPATSWRTCPSR